MKTDSITIRITETEKEALKQVAAKMDIPMSQLIREAVRSYISNNYTESEE